MTGAKFYMRDALHLAQPCQSTGATRNSRKSSPLRATFTHMAALVSVSVARYQLTLQDHRHGASASRGVLVYVPAHADTTLYCLATGTYVMDVNNLPRVVTQPRPGVLIRDLFTASPTSSCCTTMPPQELAPIRQHHPPKLILS